MIDITVTTVPAVNFEQDATGCRLDDRRVLPGYRLRKKDGIRLRDRRRGKEASKGWRHGNTCSTLDELSTIEKHLTAPLDPCYARRVLGNEDLKLIVRRQV